MNVLILMKIDILFQILLQVSSLDAIQIVKLVLKFIMIQILIVIRVKTKNYILKKEIVYQVVQLDII